MNNRFSLAGTMLIFTLPVFFQYSTQGYANGPFSVYLVLGSLWLINGLLGRDQRLIALGGLLFAFAGWTRPEGIGVSLILLFAIFFCVKYLMGVKVNARQFGISLVATITIPIIWLLMVGAKNLQQDQIGGSLNTFLLISQGNINLSGWKTIIDYAIRYFARRQDAGLITPISGMISIVGIPFAIWKKNRLFLLLFLLTLVSCLIPAAMFYVDSFSESNFYLFLEVSFDRAYLPAVIMLLVCIISLLGIPSAHEATQSDISSSGYGMLIK